MTRRTLRIITAAVLATVLTAPAPVLAATPPGPPGSTVPAPPAELLARLQAALQIALAAPATNPARADAIEKIEEALARLAEGRTPSRSDMAEIAEKLSRLTAPQPGSSTPGSSSPGPSSPGSPGPARDARALIDQYIERVNTAAIPEKLRAELLEKLAKLRARAAAGLVPASELQSALRDVAEKLGAPRPGTTSPTPPPGGSAPQPRPDRSTPDRSTPDRSTPDRSTPDRSNPETPRSTPEILAALEQARAAVRAANLSAAASQALLERIDALARRVAARSASRDEVEQTLQSVADALSTQDTVPESDDTPDPTEPAMTRPPREGSDPLADLARHIADVTARVAPLPDSDAKRAALGALEALSAKLTAGTAPTEAEVRAVFELVRNLVTPGAARERDEPAELGAQHRERMRRSLAKALEHLAGIDAPSVVTAVEALIVRLDAGEVSRDEFESVMRQVRAALAARPGARHAIVLSGVIASVQASNAPDDVKAALVAKLQLAQDTVSARPELDQRELVERALAEARAERITAAVTRVSALIETLREAATVTENAAADLLLAQALALLRPADATPPTVDALREVRALVAAAIEALSAPKVDSPEPPTLPEPTPTTPEPPA